ncbi:MAG: type II secretion system protein [Lentisphaeraceae bacterium]|nr:type II secretion system protein [Lentisphaeraceae bacterium]
MKKFTMIELLVVIAIIAILASFLLPSLAAARDKSKRTVCGSNQKQAYLGFQLYSLDHNDLVAPNENGKFYTGSGTVKIREAWDVILHLKYTKTHRVFSCPSDTESKVINFPPLGGDIKRSYSTAFNYHGDERKQSSILKPAKTLVLTERINGPTQDLESWHWYGYAANTSAAKAFHRNNKLNMLWADGHVTVKQINPYLFLDGYWRAGNSSRTGRQDPIPTD